MSTLDASTCRARRFRLTRPAHAVSSPYPRDAYRLQRLEVETQLELQRRRQLQAKNKKVM